jgi:ElaB/YqjD/DUF883 family membrane-anchored ribosome-binding protein
MENLRKLDPRGKALRIKEAVSGVLEEKLDDARVAARRARYAAEDNVDDAVKHIRRNPLRSVLVAFGFGALVGILVSRMSNRA